VAISCTCFHAHRRGGPPISALAFTRFDAHSCPPRHTLARPSRSLHKLAATHIAALAYTRFHAIAPFQRTRFHVYCCHPIHSLPITAPTNTRLVSHCDPPIHSLPSPLLSHTLAFMPIATLPYTHFIAHRGPAGDRLFSFFTCERAVHARAHVRACEHLLQRDHVVFPGGGRGGESDDEKKGGPARTGRPGSDGAIACCSAGLPLRLGQTLAAV